MTKTQLINFVEDHGQEARFFGGVRVYDNILVNEDKFQVLDVYTQNEVEFAEWIDISPDLESVKAWLGY